jgi:hypothetical protein
MLMNALKDLVRTMEHVWISSIVTNVSVCQDLMELTAQKVSKLYTVSPQNDCRIENKICFSNNIVSSYQVTEENLLVLLQSLLVSVY